MSVVDDFSDWVSGLEVLELAGLIAGVTVAVISCLICLCCCYFRRNQYKPDQADLRLAEQISASYSAEEGVRGRKMKPQFGRNFSTGTFAKSLNAQPSAGLAKLKGKKKRAAKEASDRSVTAAIDTSSISPRGEAAAGFAPNVMQNLQMKQKEKAKENKKADKKKPAKMSRKDKGLSYGRLNPEAAERIKSVRLQAKDMIPIQPAKPSAKALRMMGITEEDASRQYSESVETRMRRIAENAGGGMYSTGVSTSKLGAQIIDGFQTRTEKLKMKAKQRKEREAQKKEMQDRRRTLDKGMVKKAAAQNQPPPKAKPKPKPKGIKGFLKETNADDEEKKDDDDIDDEL